VLKTWSDFNKSFKFGNSFDFGRYDECMNLKVDDIMMQHCLVLYQYKPNHKVISVPPNSSSFNDQWRELNERFGGAVCLPSSCTVEDIDDVMVAVFNGSDFMLTRDYDQSQFCHDHSSDMKINAKKVILV
jgi:hypothetical protein